MTHRNSICLRWVAYEEYVGKSDSDEDEDDENRVNDISGSTKTDNKTDDENSAENTEDDVSESAEFEDEGMMKRQINKSGKLSKYFSFFFHEHQLMQKWKKRRKKQMKTKNFHRLMSQAKSTFGM